MVLDVPLLEVRSLEGRIRQQLVLERLDLPNLGDSVSREHGHVWNDKSLYQFGKVFVLDLHVFDRVQEGQAVREPLEDFANRLGHAGPRFGAAQILRVMDYRWQ